MKERFRFLDHTADAKFQAFGRTLEEAFANAALAVGFLDVGPGDRSTRKINHPIDVQGRDLEQLLVRFLGEIIYLFETRFFLAAAVEELTIEQGDGGLPARGRLPGR